MPRVTLIGHEPCRLLGVSANVHMNDGLDADQWRTGLLKCERGLMGEEMLISESASHDLTPRHVYHPETRNLRRWLTHEVIPVLRAVRRAA
ncbi:BRO-N domain-containing protein [Metapseudomonas lalkuanensis]|uniref:phage antirepressor n=1 Tax=Metapseudomonas lalkuanensis TaxID=2604832 RepID=UPI001FCE819F|nr:phage antirepressor [Pseudomonas lalkuanensis]